MTGNKKDEDNGEDEDEDDNVRTLVWTCVSQYEFCFHVQWVLFDWL